MIAAILPHDALLNFRRTCRLVEAETFNAFACSFFGKRSILLEEESLQQLIDISNHSRLSQFVHTLQICTDHFSDSTHQQIQAQHSALTEGNGPEAAPRSDDYIDADERVYHGLLLRQTDFWCSGRALDYLTRAVERLTACYSIVLSDAHRTTRSKQLRDAANIHMDTMLSLGREDSRTVFCKFFSICLQTAAAIPRIDEFVLDVGHEENSRGDALGRQLLDLMRLQQSPLGDKLTHLTSLRLICCPDVDLSPGASFTWFIGLFQNLSEFHLQFNAHDGAVLNGIKALHLPRLRKISLSRMDADEPDLIDLFSRHQPTLRYISLDNIALQEGTWHSIVDYVGGMVDPVVHLTLRDVVYQGFYLKDVSVMPETLCVARSEDYRNASKMLRDIAQHLDSLLAS